MRKNVTAFPDVYALSTREGTGSHSTALGSVTFVKNSSKEKPPPLGYVPRGAALKDAGVALLQDAKRKLWAILPFAWGMRRLTGLAPPRKQRHVWMSWFRAFPPPLRDAPSRSHAALLSLSRTEERQKKPWGFSPWRSVTGINEYT